MDFEDFVKRVPLAFFLYPKLTFPCILVLALCYFAFPSIHNNDDLARIASGALKGDVRSQVNLGVCYAFGYGGVERDLGQAVAWWKSAAEIGIHDLCSWLKKVCEENNVQRRSGSSYRTSFFLGTDLPLVS